MSLFLGLLRHLEQQLLRSRIFLVRPVRILPNIGRNINATRLPASSARRLLLRKLRPPGSVVHLLVVNRGRCRGERRKWRHTYTLPSRRVATSRGRIRRCGLRCLFPLGVMSVRMQAVRKPIGDLRKIDNGLLGSRLGLGRRRGGVDHQLLLLIFKILPPCRVRRYTRIRSERLSTRIRRHAQLFQARNGRGR